MSGTVAVCGAAGGIGRAVCHAFTRDGWQVVGIDLEPVERVDMAIQADLRVQAEVDRAFAEARGVGRLRALVNVAGVQLVRALQDTTADDWDALMAVNVRAAFLTMTSAVPLFEAGQGSIVNVASVHALATSPGMAAYAASKAALVGLTRAAAVDLAPDGIRVNAVLPGAVDTKMLRDGARARSGSLDDSETTLALLAERTPLGRIGAPSEIADVVAFLASDGARFITGQSFVVDGGVLARLGSE